jgi:ATP-dependent protease Clp ATPase subunit
MVAASAKPPAPDFSFRLKPAEVARHLDRFVIGQREAKKVLSVVLCDHFQHVRLTLEGKTSPFYQKQNVLILGPTGVGKTHLIRSAADLIGVPFVKADATKTSHILFIASGAFSGMDDLICRRWNRPVPDPLSKVTTPDLIAYGLEPEFVGRLPVRVACHGLDEDDLFHVLQKSESSLVHQYVRAFAAYGIRLRFQDDALRALAALAKSEQTGARRLMTVMERVFRDLKFRLPSTRIRSLAVNAALIADPAAGLRALLRAHPH